MSKFDDLLRFEAQGEQPVQWGSIPFIPFDGAVVAIAAGIYAIWWLDVAHPLTAARAKEFEVIGAPCVVSADADDLHALVRKVLQL